MKKLNRKADRYDPIIWISPDNPYGLDEVKSLSSSLMVREPGGDGKTEFFYTRAEQLTTIFIAGVAGMGDAQKGTKSSQMVAEFMSNEEKGNKLKELLKQSSLWGGKLSRMVYELEQVKGETLDSVKAVAGKPMGFLHSSAIEESMNGCTFDPNNFKKGKKPLDVYLVLPPWAIESYRVWLRATLDSFIQAILRHGPDERKLVHLKLDEMAAIMSGKMPVLTRALDQGRKYGLRIAGYWQGTSQLNEAFPIDHGQTWRSNTTAVYFAVNDLQTAKDLNQELGKETILVKGWRKGSGRSRQGRADGVADHATYGTSSDSGEDEHQKERDLLTPDEILSLSERVVIARVPGMKPVWATLLRSYEEKWLWKRQSKIGKSLQMLFDSIIVLIGSVILAALVTYLFVAFLGALQ